ncbi:MAG: hypothetical protein AABZ32_00680 [Bacteroidota bacterium]
MSTTPPPIVPPGIFPRIAKMVQRIKASPDYTDAIGHDLGIIGSEHVIDPASMKPVLKLVFEANTVKVQWPKGHAHAVRIEKDSGSGFQFLAIDTVPDYTDTTPITAAVTLKYRAMYIINDELVGQWSDVVSITV